VRNSEREESETCNTDATTNHSLGRLWASHTRNSENRDELLYEAIWGIVGGDETSGYGQAWTKRASLNLWERLREGWERFDSSALGLVLC